MKKYPLQALRLVRRERAGRAHEAVAKALREATAAEQACVREAERLSSVERLIAAPESWVGVQELRALAAAAAHRTCLHDARARARSMLAEATARAHETRGLLDGARAVRRDAVQARQALEAHHCTWSTARRREREAAEERVLDESAAARWWRRWRSA